SPTLNPRHIMTHFDVSCEGLRAKGKSVLQQMQALCKIGATVAMQT
ncbi:hypothetical protein O988_06064, partial [Pseudogymnoascus sp. VKM F-3808]